MTARFATSITATAADCDANGHVNNVVQVRWLQEIATAHWQAVATAEEQARHAWMINRLEIDFHGQTHAGETVTATTWAQNARGARFDRLTEILGPDGRLRVAARTVWVLIDRATGRPARVPRQLAARFEG